MPRAQTHPIFHLDDNRQPRRNGSGKEIYTEYHPCVHGYEEWKKKCLLPVREIRDARQWANNSEGDLA